MWLPMLFMVAVSVSLISCGDDDDVFSGLPGTTENSATAEVLGKWKILQIGNADWQTLSYNEDEGFIVFEKDGSYTTRKGGYHLFNTTGTSRYIVEGKNVNVYNQGVNVATLTFKESKGNIAVASLMTYGVTKKIVLEKQPVTNINIYEATLDLPEGFLGGGDLYLNHPVSSNNSFQFNYFQIKGEKTKFYFCTGKTGTLYMALRGRYNTGTGTYYFVEYGNFVTTWGMVSHLMSGSYITFPIKEGSTTISLIDQYSQQQIENATCTITLKLVDTEEYFDSEDELEYPHAKHNLFKVTTEDGSGTGTYSILSLAGKNPTDIDNVITESCYLTTLSGSVPKSTYLEASDGYEVNGIYYGRSDSKATVTKIKAPVNYTLKDVKVLRKWKNPNGNDSDSDANNNDENDSGNNKTRMAVDLDLPSGTKWANMNLGATSVEEYGYYYAWGEVSGYGIGTSRTYSWANYKYSGNTYKSLTKYCTNSGYGTVDRRSILLTSDDAAFSGWGGSWRIPTTADFEELYINTTHAWTEINGVKGQKFTSKSNGKSIFIPASGYRNGANHLAKNSSGYYWANSIYQNSEPCYANVFFFSSGKIENSDPMYRCYGITIRPVEK